MELQQMQIEEPALQPERKAWDAYHIIEHPGGKKWMTIGIAFLNRDHSINIFLDAFPKDGKIQLRDREERKNKKPKGESHEG